MMRQDDKRQTYRFSKETFKRLQIIAGFKGKSNQWVVETAVTRYLDKEWPKMQRDLTG